MKIILIILAFILTQFIFSCTSDPITSYNRFNIDNQSSINLYYNTGSGLDERIIEIPRFNTIEIEEAAFDGDRLILIAAEEFFTQTEEEIYLWKETNGGFIEVLQLKTSEFFNWETEKVNGFTFNHTLQVTDELLN